MIKKLIKKVKYELKFNNTQYYTRFSDKVLKSYYKRLLRLKVNQLTPIFTQKENSKLTLSILANRKNFYESIAALYSFCFWTQDIHIHYHDDGTLNDPEKEILKKIFPGIEFFKKDKQNDNVIEYLLSNGLPNCAKLRGHFLFSIRLFDMLIEKKTPYILQIDSDVLFFSKPTEILNIIEKENANGCYNQDVTNAYTFNNETIIKYVSNPMLSKFNAGVLLHNFDKYFFNFIEMILENEPQSTGSWHLEQTLFAMYATQKGSFEALPKCYDLGKKERNLGNSIISEHYVHNTGYDIQKDFIYKLCPIYLKK